MFADTRIIHRHGGYEVLAHRQIINWPKGDTIGLHRVRFNGHDDMFLRALQHDDLHWIVFDLRDVTPRGFEADVKAQPREDFDGMVLYTLRLGYSDAEEFKAKALLNFRAGWIYEVAGLESFNKAEVTAVKQYVRSRVDHLREPCPGNPNRRFSPIEGVTHATA